MPLARAPERIPRVIGAHAHSNKRDCEATHVTHSDQCDRAELGHSSACRMRVGRMYVGQWEARSGLLEISWAWSLVL
jgi:hypothetical protein